jgi:hypothetical protein
MEIRIKTIPPARFVNKIVVIVYTSAVVLADIIGGFVFVQEYTSLGKQSSSLEENPCPTFFHPNTRW